MAKQGKSPVWAGRLRGAPDPVNVAYCAGRDVVGRPMADAGLVPYDIWLNQAHALMLYQQEIIDQSTHTAIQGGLRRIRRDYDLGRFELDPELEDVHMNIERRLVEACGEDVGGMLHTGRSRNDQSATDVRLYLRWHCLQLLQSTSELVQALLERAEQTVRCILPGHSHSQPASISTYAHYLCSYAQALLRDIERLRNSFRLMNQSPLGSAAGFATGWPIQRQSTARWLAFDSIQENSLDCITNRWEMEAQLVTAAAFLLTHLSTMAQDMIHMSSAGLRFIRLPDEFVTGSSIMPQKRNPDFAEVTRAKAALVHGSLQSLFGIAKGSLSGYNRDSQWTKYIAMDVIDEIRDAPHVFREIVSRLEIFPERMSEEAERNFINAIDLADYLAADCQLPFRKAYEIVAELVRENEADGRFTYDKCRQILKQHDVPFELSEKRWEQQLSLERLLNRRKSFGGPAPSAVRDCIDNLRKDLSEMRRWTHRQVERIDQARRNLMETINKAIR
ncbi:argininosuccinate lyase [Candidatus Sumerlaeota bacterium]